MVEPESILVRSRAALRKPVLLASLMLLREGLICWRNDLRTLLKVSGIEVALIHVDAHADINDTMFGETVAHGTPFRGNTALIDANLLYEMLCVLPGVPQNSIGRSGPG